MKKLKKIVKMIGLVILGFVLTVVVAVALFMNLSPEFGDSATTEQKLKYEKSGHYKDGKFVNETPISMNFDLGNVIDFIKGSPSRQPSKNIDIQKVDSLEIVQNDPNETRLTWFGHSAFLLEMDGKNILLDPMLGKMPSPTPWFGARRYSRELPIEIEKLPFIDAVIISHDHYDHLDYGSIMKLKDKVSEFYMPLGVGNHLRSWGVPDEKIHELNWWDETKLSDIQLVCTPARHFSGRGILDNSATLWSSWVILGKNDKIYFSGDGGYAPHFKEIGEKFGEFDLALMECGQYNKSWADIHMMPEETAQAGIDVKAKLLMPIHWGAFTLALHDWTDPIERISKKAKELHLELVTPKIGESIILKSESYPQEKWWKAYQ